MRNAFAAYRDVENATLSDRALEASVLVRAAARLSQVQQQWDSSARKELLDESLLYNQRLWTLFQSELMDPNNLMPLEIKRNLLTLSVYVDKRIFEVMAYPERDKLDILISINRNIAAGLRGELIPEAEIDKYVKAA